MLRRQELPHTPLQRRSPRAALGELAPLLVGLALLLTATLVINLPRQGKQSAPPAPIATEGSLVGQPAPQFTLLNQDGTPIRLADLRSHVVALTFLYTNCPDLCPITLGKFGMVREQLGPSAAEVAFVAITVDPARDTPEQLRQYLSTQHLSQRVQFLTGDPANLATVWRDYQIVVARGVGGDTATYEIVHSDRIYLIDRNGCVRTQWYATALPAALVGSIQGLLGDTTAGGGETARSATPCGE